VPRSSGASDCGANTGGGNTGGANTGGANIGGANTGGANTGGGNTGGGARGRLGLSGGMVGSRSYGACLGRCVCIRINPLIVLFISMHTEGDYGANTRGGSRGVWSAVGAMELVWGGVPNYNKATA